MASRQQPQSNKSRDQFARALIGAMVFVVVACVLTTWQLSTLNNIPSWWEKLDNNINVTEQSGIELENRITTAFTRLRPPGQESWAVAVNQDQLNSWIAHRLRETVYSFSNNQTKNKTLDQFGDIRIQIKPSGISIGAQIHHAQGSTLVWAVITLTTDPSGRFAIDTHRLYIGGMRVPVILASNYLSSDRLGSTKVDLGDGRTVQINAIRPADQRLEIALSTIISD